MASQRRRVQAVVVLYQCAPHDSKTLRSLREIVAARPDFGQLLDMLVYDNSPQPAAEAETQGMSLGSTVEYRHDSRNGGLATAYQAALQTAVEHQLDWLLLLDQDTTLSSEYFAQLFEALNAEPPAHVCAVVPKQVRDGVVLSPRLVRAGRELPVEPGVASEPLTVFNSASCVRVQALMGIGGFPQQFPLDYLDHVVFHRLQAKGGRMLVLPVAIEHQLSIKNLAEEMSLPRYQRLLDAEWGYILEVKPKGGPVVQRLRLLLRALKQAKLPNKQYARLTLAAAWASLPRP